MTEPSAVPSAASPLTATRRRRPLFAVIALGGALGSLARWSLSLAWPVEPAGFPWATFAANVSGCLAIGVLLVLVVEVWAAPTLLRPFLGVGFLGGYTTFSTYVLDTRTMLVEGLPGLAGAYLAGTVLGGLAALWLAIVATRGLLALVGAR